MTDTTTATKSAGETDEQTGAQAAPPAPPAPDETKRPWEDGEFDAEKAWTLIQNLRNDKAALSGERDAALAEITSRDTRISELETEVQTSTEAANTARGDLDRLTSVRTKEALLAEAGLPVSLAANVVGDDEDGWKASVESLTALRDSVSAPPARRPDPAQTAEPPAPDKDQVAREFFEAALGS